MSLSKKWGTTLVLVVIAVGALAVGAIAQKPAYDPEVEAVARGIFLELMSPY